MIFHTLTRGALLLAAGTLLSQVIHFPNILPLAGALLTWAVLLGTLTSIFGTPAAVYAMGGAEAAPSIWKERAAVAKGRGPRL